MKIDTRLCVLCRGRGYCGLAYCPIIARNTALTKLKGLTEKKEIYGSSPPSVFVGRIGYPKVRIGPSSPPLSGDTQIYELPESWLKLRIEDILDYRYSLITGYNYASVNQVNEKFVNEVRDIAMSIKPVEIEMKLIKPPVPIVIFDEEQPPFGPSSPIERFKIVNNPSIPKIIDSLYYDEIKAKDAIIYLYERNFPVSYISKVMSIGTFGEREKRRLVPTRWSITAVDSTISEELLKKVKGFQEISEIEVYELKIHDNLFISILFPRSWSFEWMEAWWPGSTWNPQNGDVEIEGDYEYYRGRKNYPSIGGCYYSARLATAELLLNKKRQATAVLLREIYPGFNVPIGVWFVRESIREMYKRGPVMKTYDINEVVSFLNKETKLGSAKWIASSKIIQLIMTEKKITEYF
ncbi:hypothetical protein IOK49_06155 [Fervidicoccus fontis]|uniref:DNA repair protein n=2 Tax=Fervidicoccus fontis TaxID=683846 RepID=I0A1K4_FERFK|nr:Nre family DNA repair protein [Fervidicoccus fontis]AFH42861.1 hypothetical protein FFONT_0873 [Fervidicoccus fontis Kam940]MBE9391646.1 hypothetical protein [Fervidicoccus fontis]PMB75956.1 MAG: hypothetical protein C0188_00760 [Fervidicoccus fontis]PMB77843.1 MAG: hypothetical protein C0177_01845 [Fervidicoccus fontis]HEW63518.1 hypothetical protein [Fervidicoccus fontis]